jgi:hypothetical protein
MNFNNRCVQRVAGHQSGVLIEEAPGGVVYQSPFRPASERAVAMEDLLERLRIDDRVDSALRRLFKKPGCSPLERVFAPGGVHEDVRVDQSHGARAPASGTDSIFIRRTVETGNLKLASRRTAASFSSLVAPP